MHQIQRGKLVNLRRSKRSQSVECGVHPAWVAHERGVEAAHALARLVRADAARVARRLLFALRVHLDLLCATPQLGGAAVSRRKVARLELVHGQKLRDGLAASRRVARRVDVRTTEREVHIVEGGVPCQPVAQLRILAQLDARGPRVAPRLQPRVPCRAAHPRLRRPRPRRRSPQQLRGVSRVGDEALAIHQPAHRPCAQDLQSSPREGLRADAGPQLGLRGEALTRLQRGGREVPPVEGPAASGAAAVACVHAALSVGFQRHATQEGGLLALAPPRLARRKEVYHAFVWVT
eukprot:scaffold1007_cov61-Phaeocystis_antarctica.AAC.6